MNPTYTQGQKLPITVAGHTVTGEVYSVVDTEDSQILSIWAIAPNGDNLYKITYNDDKTLMQ